MKFAEVWSKVKSLDMFGVPNTFSIESQSEFQTHVGAFSSILLYTLIASSSYYLLTDLFYKRNPNIVSNTVFN